ncbi:MAG: AAA family ATPase [Candidatus Lokiarchaeota archaeon]|nr:AAA family ATPase [Candidatus Lokiarchaeota archaeon]
MIITISGLHGTGKSTVGKRIAKSLGLRYYSTGQAFRDLAMDHEMTLEEFTAHAENNPKIDKELDEKIVELAKEGNIVIDSQLSGYILETKADFKILLACPIETRVKRMADRDKTSYEEKFKETTLRETSEKERFKELYGIDLGDTIKAREIHDLVLETENMTIEEIVKNILDNIKKL